MPLVSESQRKFMHSQKPEMAKEWEAKTPKGQELPEKVGKFKAPLRMIGKADDKFSLPMIAVNFTEETKKPKKHMLAKFRDGGGPQVYGEQSLPEYDPIYGTEKGLKKLNKQDAEAQALRRRADAGRMIHTFGFHGEAPSPQIVWDPANDRSIDHVYSDKSIARGLTNNKENNRLQVHRLTIKRDKGSYVPPTKKDVDERTP